MMTFHEYAVIDTGIDLVTIVIEDSQTLIGSARYSIELEAVTIFLAEALLMTKSSLQETSISHSQLAE